MGHQVLRQSSATTSTSDATDRALVTAARRRGTAVATEDQKSTARTAGDPDRHDHRTADLATHVTSPTSRDR
jgi:hypothetical protein